MKFRIHSSAGVLAGLLLVAPTSVFAYLDPGAGSMLLQMLIGGIVAGLYTLKLYWQKVRGFLSRLTGGKTSHPTDLERERLNREDAFEPQRRKDSF